MRDLREVLVPALEALDGFRGGTLLADRDTGDVVGTPYWDSLDHLEGSQTRSSNAAAAFLVLTEGASMEVSVCDGLLTSALPPDLAPEPGSADS